MPTVTVPRTDLSTEEMVTVLRDGLGAGYNVLPGMTSRASSARWRDWPIGAGGPTVVLGCPGPKGVNRGKSLHSSQVIAAPSTGHCIDGTRGAGIIR